MATNAFIGGWTLKFATNVIEEVVSVSDVGKTRSTEEVTHFSSPAGTKEFISGLAEGDEISFDCNYLPAGTQQLALIADVDSGTASSVFALEVTDGTTTVIMTFSATPVSYKFAPNIEGANGISFTYKMTGDIVYT